MKLIQIDYRNWKILFSSIGDDWTATCCPSDGEPLSVGRFYPDRQFACAEAQTFIDRTILRCQIASLLDTWLEAGQISSNQHDQADLLIAALVKTTVSNHFEFAQAQRLQIYASRQLACAEAQVFIQQTILQCQIISLMHAWLEAGQINNDQYDQAVFLIMALARTSISDHFEFAQIQWLRFPENQPDSLL